MKDSLTPIRPLLRAAEFRELLKFCASVESAQRDSSRESAEAFLHSYRGELKRALSADPSNEAVALAFVKSSLLDLVAIGWKVKVEHHRVRIASPAIKSVAPEESRDLIRKSHLLERDEQLRQDSVREFIRGMEQRRLTENGWHSIFSVMRDGGELASALETVEGQNDEEQKIKRLGEAVSPYIQLVTEDGVCEHTGLSLRDIWRYFRHTWVNSYKSLPGRSMAFLFRDAAAPNHPVIGIAALGSSVAQQRLRDKWIGWDPYTMVQTILNDPSSRYAKWLLKSLDDQIGALYLDDFFFDGTCKRQDIEAPTAELIAHLQARGEDEIRAHQLYPQSAAHKAPQRDRDVSAYWEKQAQTHLFRSKRCKTLSRLLQIRMVFQEHGLKSGVAAELRKAMSSSRMQDAVARLVRLIKAQRVGINMMDIVVCGAIAPYNYLLGGKLVCMLLCSPEVVMMYEDRYAEQASIIASSMKGAPVVRTPQLVLLGTTSLYGVNSSQYNRVRIPCDAVGGEAGKKLSYELIGRSEGYGSYQFSELTVELGEILLGRTKEGRRVNSIFGEGVNPRMRKLREALDEVGLPSDEVLRHRNPRIVYAVSLARNASDVLLGLSRRARYLIPRGNPRKKTELIAEYWRRRWLLKRIGREGILDEVSKHTLAYPVTHGGRVDLPSVAPEQQEFEY